MSKQNKKNNRPLVASNNDRPVVTQDNRPVAVSDNRPVAVSENNRPVVVSDNNRPVIAKDDNKPVISTEDNRPVVVSDTNYKSENSLFICAIDFGTTYSGYAYSTRSSPKEILCPHWKSSSTCTTLISHKAPTTVLLDDKENFVAFGYDAEAQYLELAEDENAQNFYYFRRFKMILYDKLRDGRERLSTKTKVRDITGKELLAVDIFSHAIKYLKDHLLKEHANQGTTMKDTDINWVLTVPAIWDDPAKQFMRKAAEKAGIDNKRLVIALEPEAASIFCKELPVEKFDGGSDNINVFSPGQKYLVLDAGGGTIDMTVHEVKSGGKLHELSRASGGDWGGVMVDKTFKQMLIDIVGEEFMKEYCRTNTADYIDLFRDFEIKKREKSQTEKVTLKISPTFLEKYKDFKKMGMGISDETKRSRYAKSLKWAGDKIRMEKELFDNLFNPSCEKIVQHVKKVLSESEVKGTKIILMVGGFSESAILQDAIRKAFPECRVVVPHEAGLAVLKGAVLFGHDQSVVASRVAKFTYGIECSMPFDEKKHDPQRKTKDGRCQNIFNKHVQAGNILYLNEEQGKHSYYPVEADQTAIAFSLYTSEAANPMYTDEPGCKLLGTLEMDISDIAGGLEREFEAKLQFGGTEITVSARNVRTNKTVSAEFNFLGDEP